jgi:hypothetical protein
MVELERVSVGLLGKEIMMGDDRQNDIQTLRPEVE